MTFTSRFARLLYSRRLRQIEEFCTSPFEIQQRQLSQLINRSIGCKYLNINEIKMRVDFCKLPVVEYEDITNYIDDILEGGKDVLSKYPVKWFAKSSGTTDNKSKFIPVTRDSLLKSQFMGGVDVIGLALRNFPDTQALAGKALTLGGAHKMTEQGSGLLCGDLSAIMIENTPRWFSGKRVPTKETALIPNFEEKIERICEETIGQNITSFAGVPSWNLVLMNKILDFTGKENIHQLWPDMSLFAHGGISFIPYREQYQRLFPDPKMRYIETYNASEGFFAIQDNPNDSSMLLMLDYGIYYEFIPYSTLNDHTTIVPLEGVRIGENYVMVISTTGGLWRYIIGDTVEFTSLTPHKIKITGRTKQFMNVFGEELIEDNAIRGLQAACQSTDALIEDYTVAPIFMKERKKGGHQWLIEFKRQPNSIEQFATTLDQTLQSLNSDYEAKRSNNSTLNPPLITTLPSGMFYAWMGSRGKIGGQNKVPRLANDRKIAEQIIEMLPKQ